MKRKYTFDHNGATTLKNGSELRYKKGEPVWLEDGQADHVGGVTKSQDEEPEEKESIFQAEEAEEILDSDDEMKSEDRQVKTKDIKKR